MNWKSGLLLHIHIAPIASAKMVELNTAELVPGRGIVNDRYYNQNGSYSKIPDIRDVTLIENEVLDALASNQPPLQEKPIILKPIEHRRNLTTFGVPLNYLVGKKFQIGRVELEGIDLCRPCRHLCEVLNQNNIIKEFLRRGGLRCQILSSSSIEVGNKIRVFN